MIIGHKPRKKEYALGEKKRYNNLPIWQPELSEDGFGSLYVLIWQGASVLFQASELQLLVQAGFKGKVWPILACLGDTATWMSVFGLMLSHVRDIGKLGREELSTFPSCSHSFHCWCLTLIPEGGFSGSLFRVLVQYGFPENLGPWFWTLGEKLSRISLPVFLHIQVPWGWLPVWYP